MKCIKIDKADRKRERGESGDRSAGRRYFGEQETVADLVMPRVPSASSRQSENLN